MNRQNPFEPTTDYSQSADGTVVRVILVSLALFAMSALSVGFLSRAYLMLPLVFGVALPWAAGFRVFTCIASVVIAYLSAYIGIETCLEFMEIGPVSTEQATGIDSRLLVSTGLFASFLGVFMTLLVRIAINMLLKVNLHPGSKMLERLVHA